MWIDYLIEDKSLEAFMLWYIKSSLRKPLIVSAFFQSKLDELNREEINYQHRLSTDCLLDELNRKGVPPEEVSKFISAATQYLLDKYGSDVILQLTPELLARPLFLSN